MLQKVKSAFTVSSSLFSLAFTLIKEIRVSKNAGGGGHFVYKRFLIDLGRDYDLYEYVSYLYEYVSYRIVSNDKEGDVVTFNLGGKSGSKARSLARAFEGEGYEYEDGDSGTVSTTFDETPSGTPGDNKIIAGDGSVKIYAKWDSVTDENQVPVDATYFLYYIENGLYTEISAGGAKKDTNTTYANSDNKVVGKVTYGKDITSLLPKKSAFAKGEGDKSLTFALYAVVKGELVGNKSGGQVTVKSGKDDASSGQ